MSVNDHPNGTKSRRPQGHSKKQSWRDVLKVHPAAELFPLMSDAELKELGEDIKRVAAPRGSRFRRQCGARACRRSAADVLSVTHAV